MKRQYFDISLNGAVVATTFAWNSAIRTIERLVRERSVAVGGLYKLVDSLSEGTDKWHFTHGHRTWQSPHERCGMTSSCEVVSEPKHEGLYSGR